jgi:hypothetical protein
LPSPPAESPSKAIGTNLDPAKWVHEKGDSEPVVLRDDPTIGGMELLVRFPAGHVIPPHWHARTSDPPSLLS